MPRNRALSNAPFGVKYLLAQRLGLRADAAGARQQQDCLLRRIERPLVGRQDDRTGMRHPGMNAQQRMGVAIADLDRRGVDPHHDLAVDGPRPRGVIAAINTHGGIVADSPNDLGEDAEGRHWLGPQVWLLLLKHRLDLTTRAAVDALGGPILLPVPQELVLGFQRLEAPSGQRGALGMLNRTLDAPFQLGSATRAGPATTAQ